MALPDHYTGKDGVISIDGTPTTLVNFNLDISVGVITSGQIGQVSDISYPGKKAVSGSITQVLVTGDLMAMMMGADADITTSTLETLLAATDISGNTRQEIAVTSDPSNPTSVKVALTVGNEASTAGSIVIHGTDSAGEYVAEVIDFAAMSVGDGTQVKYGTQAFAETNYVDVSGNLQQGTAPSPDCNTLKIEGVTGTKSIVLGTSEHFTIIGKVEDANGKSFQMTAVDCFFTGGSFPIGDAEALVQTDLPFVMKNPNTGLTLVWTSA